MVLSVRKPISRKDASVIFRTTSQEKALIYKAAKAEKMEPATYVRQSILKQAQMDLADRTEFIISQKNMALFIAALDQPVRRKPALAKLLNTKSILES